MDRWMDRPPVPCHRTAKDEPKSGQPFFVEDFHYIDVVRGPQGPQAGGRVKPLVSAASWIQRMCDAPGSPFVCLTVEEAAALEAARQDREDLLVEIDELRAQIAELEQHVNPTQLAQAVVIEMARVQKQKSKPAPEAA